MTIEGRRCETFELPRGVAIFRTPVGLFVEVEHWPGMDGRWRFPASDPHQAIALARRIVRRLRHPMVELLTQRWFWLGQWSGASLRFMCLEHRSECVFDSPRSVTPNPSHALHPMKRRRPLCPSCGAPMRLMRR